MFGLRFLAFTEGVGGGGGLNRGSTLSRVTQYFVHNICRFTYDVIFQKYKMFCFQLLANCSAVLTEQILKTPFILSGC